MAYAPLTVDASSQTWAQLQTRGFIAHVQTLVAALTTNAATEAEKTIVNQLLTPDQAARPLQRAAQVVDNYLTSRSDKTSAKAQVADLQLAYAAIAAALGEIGVLIDAN